MISESENDDEDDEASKDNETKSNNEMWNWMSKNIVYFSFFITLTWFSVFHSLAKDQKKSL